ncbi:hypothetical protein BCR39DRAFT_531021 [Naematelia encephala]|uniref:Uncharacterized protein n=1 Tax=Naematelia encephala TaxID=71784 RepID=A0A1Y2B5M7_9TREE|nr:hypothetical protein BCR39DRAFT_531021 [Naematelia encephala]
MPAPSSARHSTPPQTPPREQLSPSTQALISLSQDITALISLSVEAGASLVNDWFRSTLGLIGLGEVVQYSPGTNDSTKPKGRGESVRGLAIVVVGASEATGQSLTLHLAKCGYIVFPLLPLPSPDSPPTSAAFSHLLLTWSGIQKRLRIRNPRHPGAVVPIITDPESSGFITPSKAKGRFQHAGETVRIYCRDNGLELVAVVCASQGPRKSEDGGDEEIEPPSTPPTQLPISPSPSPTSRGLVPLPAPRHVSLGGIAKADETTLLNLYRTNILDPLSITHELSDLLAATSTTGRGSGRVVLVNGGSNTVLSTVTDDDESGVMQIVGAARGEMTKLLRKELARAGIDVCEVVVGMSKAHISHTRKFLTGPGPMTPRIAGPGYHLRSGSDESNDSNHSQTTAVKAVLLRASEGEGFSDSTESEKSRQAILASRLHLLSRLWAVDDALLFSSVRRAIEDRYPRAKHHAGISPLIESLVGVVPGSGLIKVVGRWVVGRLLMPRS